MQAIWNRIDPCIPVPPKSIGALSALGLHAAAAALLLTLEPARTVLVDSAPILVELISAVRPANPAPARPVQHQPPFVPPTNQPRPAEPPLLAAATETAPAARASTPAEATAPGPAQTAIAAVPPALQAASHPAAPPATLPVSPPIFNAAYLDNPAPAYPAASRRTGEQGRVILRVLVSPAGRAEEIEVRTGSGSARLDESARDTVRRWKFVPARRGEESVPAWVLIPISFRLDS